MTVTSPTATAPRRRRLWWAVDTLLIAIIAYAPLLLSKRGLLADDTKIYLYLDPGRLLRTAASLWSRDFAFGTVTHQNIGYLFPMAPYYLAIKTLSIPMWIGQRIWMGSLLFLAAIGVRRCAKDLGLQRLSGDVAGFIYMLTPFILVNIDRTSALLLPWAGLGWMMSFTIHAARRGDWRHPALFAIVVAAVGGVNATSILMIAFAPLLYLVSAAWSGEITWRRCTSTIVKIGALSFLVSIWWMAGLWAEDKFGINVLTYTESFQTVTTTSTASEVLRGLGYWYFYGQDGLQNWTLSAYAYMNGHVVPIMSYVAPIAGFVAALCIRWRYRLFLAATAFVGFIVAVSAYPLASPTPIGDVFKWATDHTTIAFALRSSNRVVPIIVLALALCAGAGFQALRPRMPRISLVGGCALVLCAGLGLLPLFQGRAITSNLTLNQPLPKYVFAAAKQLDKSPDTSNVLGLPGLDFAYYRFGTSNDSIWPGITHRPWVSNQVQPEGEPSSIVLTRGLDEVLQNGVAQSTAIAPIARLLNAGDILVQMNTQYERYSTPLPSYMWGLFSPTPKGMQLVHTYGPRANFTVINGPYIDEQVLSLPAGYKFPKSLAIFKVDHPRTLVRTESLASPQIVAGNGEGLVTMASDGLLNNDRAIYFDSSLSRVKERRLANTAGAWLILTDSNQKRLDEFGTLNSTQGYVETKSERPLVPLSNEEALTEFSNSPKNSQTVAYMTGLKYVGASSYGNPITNNPEVQAYKAVDGNLNTSWQTAAFTGAVGQYIEMKTYKAHEIHRIHFVQVQSSIQNRWITQVQITVNNTHSFTRTLTTASHTSKGQWVTIPTTRGSEIRVTILRTFEEKGIQLAQASAVGFAEIDTKGFGPVTRGLLLPESLLSNVGSAAETDKISLVVDRSRASTFPVRQDPELALLRYVELPYTRHFSVRGYATLNPAISAAQLNQLVGRHAGTGLSVSTASDSTTLTGSLTSSAWSAFDGNNDTIWSPAFRTGPDQWVNATLSSSTTLSQFSMTIVNDGYRAIPLDWTVSNGSTTESFSLPATVATQNGHLNREQTFSIHVPALTGNSFTFTVTKLKSIPEIDRISGGENWPSIGVADITIPGVSAGVTPTTFNSGCRSDLVKVNGVAVPVDVSGSMTAALAQNDLTVTPCSTARVALHRGFNKISSALGYVSGININDLVLTSAGTNPGPTATMKPVKAQWYGQSVVRATVPSSMAGRLVVLGQSYAAGWHAVINGRDLGTPVLVDGASMGWTLPTTLHGETPIAFIWEPQNTIVKALAVSALAFLICLVLAVFDRPRRRQTSPVATEALEDSSPSWIGFNPHIQATNLVLYAAAIVVAAAVSIFLLPFTVGASWLWIRRERFGIALYATAVALVAAGGVATAFCATLGWPNAIDWPGRVDYANSFVWIAVAFWVLTIVATSNIGHRRSESGLLPSRAPDHTAPQGEQHNATEVAPASGGDVTNENPSERMTAPPLRSSSPPATLPAPPPRLAPSTEEVALAPSTDGAPRRRRGLNMPEPVTPAESDEESLLPTHLLPTSGMRRTIFLLLAGWRARKTPGQFHHIMSIDSINQVIGKTPIYNRAVLDLTDASVSHADGLIERGARVTTIRVTGQPESPDVATAQHIPASNNQFDLVFATNVLSAVDDPITMLNEIIRVTRPGGTIYLQNRLWRSFWGGRETSPWHLVSGTYARRRYIRRTGHEPDNRYGENLFKMTVGRLEHLIHAHDEMLVFIARPRILPPTWKWTLHVPLLRDLLVQDVIIVAERQAFGALRDPVTQ